MKFSHVVQIICENQTPNKLERESFKRGLEWRSCVIYLFLLAVPHLFQYNEFAFVRTEENKARSFAGPCER